MCKAREPVALFGAVCGNSIRGDRSQRGWGLMCGKSHIGLEFKLKAKQEKKRDDERWKLLVRKVVSAKAISSLSLPKRKREEEGREITDHHGIKNFQL
ncbi:hypothetical protein CsSME_00007058 [Camellia sinensis var. sinensis]